MSVWKQIALVLIIIAAAAVSWIRYYPGANEQLAKLGLDWLPVSALQQSQQAAKSGASEAGAPNRRGGGPRGAVVAGPVTEQTINDRLSAIGTGRAARSVEVTPYESGRMIELLVQSGATVRRGDIIARLDSDAEEIAAERAKIALRDTEARLDRMKALQKSNAVTNVQVTDAELAVDNARLQVREAELKLSRRSIHSPINGIVGILPIAAGNYVTTQTVIATIDDRSEILVDFWVPERFASAARVGSALTATSIARPGEIFEGKVSAVDNRIDPESRTLQVQARIPNETDRLRAGMSFQVGMRFPGDHYPAVNPLAVQWDTDGAYVWAIREGRAKRVPVHIIQRNTNSVLVEAALKQGDEVVVEGLHLAREGAELNIVNAPTKPEPASQAPQPAANGS